MTNVGKTQKLSFDSWFEKYQSFLVIGIISYYDNQPFPNDREDRFQRGVELGRLIAASATAQGMIKKSDLIRKVANKSYYAIMKNKKQFVRKLLSEDKANCMI